MIALVLTGVVALLVYGTLRTGLGARDRQSRLHETVEADALARGLLSDAIRHPADWSSPTDTVFAIDADARASLRFLSRGIAAPFGTGAAWDVRVAADSAGVRMIATRRARDGTSIDGATMTTSFPRARALRVRAWDAATGAWSDSWTAPQRMPAAVAIALLDANGRQLGPTLVSRTALGASPGIAR
jgi:hypothetical protein